MGVVDSVRSMVSKSPSCRDSTIPPAAAGLEAGEGVEEEEEEEEEEGGEEEAEAGELVRKTARWRSMAVVRGRL